MKISAIAFLVCTAIVLGLSSAKVAGAYSSAAASSPFLVTRSADTYHAVSLSTGSSYNGTLKFVVESAVTELEQGGGGTVRFAAGTFDLGSEYFRFDQIHNITFEGQGIDVTLIQNASSQAADTEPFNLSGAFGVTVRDMTVAAGGPVRLTSDALDFDQGNDSVIERVKITSSRGRGIVFDGKNAGWTSAGNVVRSCVINGVPGSGVQFLASSNNRIEDCTITNVGRHGIEVAKSSPTAAQPNKKSNGNVVRNNVVDNSGIDGILVTSSDGNRIEGNRVTNSSNAVAAADGIRITSADAVTCDENVVDGNVATDNQPTKTQRYGLNIASALCSRTVVAANNDFSGNRLGSIHDVGTATRYGGPNADSFFAYANFSGGVRVAAGDVDGDGRADIVTGTGPGRIADVKVFSGATRSLLVSFSPYDFEGGVFVGAGDVNRDGKADIVTGAGAGGGAHVKFLDGASLKVLASFTAFNDFSGGVRVAAADVTGDGRADIITGAGAGGGANVKVFDGATFLQIRSFFAFTDFNGGVFVGAGDVTGDGRADIIAGAGAGGGAHVKVFDGATFVQLASFFAFTDFGGGVRVSGGDVTGDGRSDIVVGAGPGAGANVKVFNGVTFAQTASFFAFNQFTGGLFAGAGDLTGDGRADIIAGADQGGGAHVKIFNATAL
jgi:parallel beta-helix repeat protein